MRNMFRLEVKKFQANRILLHEVKLGPTNDTSIRSIRLNHGNHEREKNIARMRNQTPALHSCKVPDRSYSPLVHGAQFLEEGLLENDQEQ